MPKIASLFFHVSRLVSETCSIIIVNKIRTAIIIPRNRIRQHDLPLFLNEVSSDFRSPTAFRKSQINIFINANEKP